MRKAKILIVDDEPDYLEILKGLLEQEGYDNITTEKNPTKVPSMMEESEFDLIILDVYMQEMNGLDLLEIITSRTPQTPVIMVTALNDTDIALQAIKLGAYEYIIKPPDADRLFLTIQRALQQKIIEKERDSLRTIAIKSHKDWKDFSDIITNSPLMHKVFELVEIFAPTNETVLVVGETGTGKDLIAKKIHDMSPRSKKPFVVVNLASISPTLFESELFGHERGAFTGATNEKTGFFEAAEDGTIFLDEIGELPKELQGKLLRTIQYGEIYRIGSSKPISLNIRIIAATNKDLVDAVNKNEFRADLYYRLNRGYIHLPALRERGDDVVHLANYFLKMGNRLYQKNVSGFTDDVLKSLILYNFPGNVRELENLILSAVAKTKDDEKIDELTFSSQKASVDFTDDPQDGLKLISLKEAMKEHILSILNYTGGNVQKAAVILELSERTLQRRLKDIRESNNHN